MEMIDETLFKLIVGGKTARKGALGREFGLEWGVV